MINWYQKKVMIMIIDLEAGQPKNRLDSLNTCIQVIFLRFTGREVY